MTQCCAHLVQRLARQDGRSAVQPVRSCAALDYGACNLGAGGCAARLEHSGSAP